MMRPNRPSQRGGLHGTAATADAGTVTVHVPIAFRQRRGRKALVASHGVRALRPAPSRQRTDAEAPQAVRALARAFRWRRLLETGAVATVREIAATENINPSYVSRVLRLTLLAPEIVNVLVTASSEATASVDRWMRPFPCEWEGQQPAGI